METNTIRSGNWLISAVLLSSAPLAHADYDAGWSAHQRGDYQRALAEFVPAAGSDARAALALWRMFERGEGVQRDPHQALMWLRQAGEIGDAATQFELGQAYASGVGAPLESREAAQWYRRAAERGHSGAQFALGRVYVDGLGVPPDGAEGRKWIELAADAGHGPARVWLGLPVAPAQPALAAPNIAPSPAPGTPPLLQPPAQPNRYADEEPTAPHRPRTTWYYGFNYGYGWGSPFYGWYDPFWGPPWPRAYWGGGWGHPWYGWGPGVNFGVVVRP